MSSRASAFDPAAVDVDDPRPLVLLDVDGVLVPQPYRAASRPGERTIHMAPISLGVPVQFTDASGSLDLREKMGGLTACFGAGVIEMIDAIQADARMVWATSWERMAHDELAPTIGHGHDWPFLDSRHADWPWKWNLVKQIPDGVPLVWVDDDAIPTSANRWAASRDADTLLIRTDKLKGIGPIQQKRIIDFVQRHRA